MAPGHDRPRCVYVDFLNTGPAVSKTLRTVVNKSGGIRKAGDLCIVDLLRTDGDVVGAAALHLGTGAPVIVSAKATILATGGLTRLYRRNSASANMGGDGYALALAGRRVAGRHGIRAVFPDRPSGSAADRHGPDHVGPVPLQARRAAAEQPHGGIHAALRRRRGRQIRHHARRRQLRDSQGGRSRPRLAARRRLSQLSALSGNRVARILRARDRPPCRQRHRSHQDADRGRADRALPHGWHRGRRANANGFARPVRRRRSGRRRQWRQPAFRQRNYRGTGVRPPCRPQRR